MECVPAVYFDVILLPLLSAARVINDDDAGVIRKSRGRLVRGSIEPSAVGALVPLCENSQRALRANGVELNG